MWSVLFRGGGVKANHGPITSSFPKTVDCLRRRASLMALGAALTRGRTAAAWWPRFWEGLFWFGCTQADYDVNVVIGLLASVRSV